MFCLIAAIDLNRAIGFNGDQLVYIRQDLMHFKSLTKGHTIIMGRKTNEALPHHHLPDRRNIVISSQDGWTSEGCEVAHTVDEALALSQSDGDVFVIGGGQIYQALFPRADKLFLTVIEHKFPQADTFFPDYSDWIIEDESELMHDDKSGLSYRFVTFSRPR